MRKNDLYRITAYHCCHCGAPTDPNRLLCDYCRQQALLKKYIQNNQIDRKRVRVLIKTEENYINFNNILSFDGLTTEVETIEATALSDDRPRYIQSKSYDNWGMDIPLTQRGTELCRMLSNNREYDIRVENLDTDMAFEYKALFIGASLPCVELNTLMTATLTFEPTDIRGIITTIVPEELTCPNCGAPVQSRLGACNYCGGWLEYEF